MLVQLLQFLFCCEGKYSFPQALKSIALQRVFIMVFFLIQNYFLSFFPVTPLFSPHPALSSPGVPHSLLSHGGLQSQLPFPIPLSSLVVFLC